MQVKVVQNLGLAKFKEIQAQIKETGMEVVVATEGGAGRIHIGSILGKVTNVLFLGKKQEVETTMESIAKGSVFQFKQHSGYWYLMKMQ